MVSAGSETDWAEVDTAGSVILTLGATLEATTPEVCCSGIEVDSAAEVLDSEVDVSLTTPVGASKIPEEEMERVVSGTEIDPAWVVGAARLLLLAISELAGTAELVTASEVGATTMLEPGALDTRAASVG